MGDLRDQARNLAITTPAAELRDAYQVAAAITAWADGACSAVEREIAAGQHGDAVTEWVTTAFGPARLGRPASGDSINDLLSGDQAQQNAARYVAELPRADLSAGILKPSAAAAESLFGQLGFASASRSFIEDKTRAWLPQLAGCLVCIPAWTGRPGSWPPLLRCKVHRYMQ